MFTYKKPYCIGIKGAGMVGLATLLHRSDCLVRGSDTEEIFFSDSILEDLNIHIDTFDDKIPEDCDCIIYSAAYLEDHIQRMYAKEHLKDIPQLSYFEAVGLFAEQFKTLAITGTHGKTSTTTLAGILFRAIGLDPTILVGSQVPDFQNKNAILGSSQYFIVEACEYKRHFFHIDPYAVLCTNIDYDHVDFFKTPEEYRDTLHEYIELVPESHRILHDSIGDVTGCSYGKNTQNTCTLLSRQGKKLEIQVTLGSNTGMYKVSLIGDHMIANFLGALTLAWNIAQEESISWETFYDNTHEALLNFRGIARRTQYYGSIGDCEVFDDYAHHPIEIETTIRGLQLAYPGTPIHIVFQSHTYTRTAALSEAFASSLSQADSVSIAPIYSSAREYGNIFTNKDFLHDIQTYNSNVFFGTFEEIEAHIRSTNKSGVLCTMGAGDVWQIAERLVR